MPEHLIRGRRRLYYLTWLIRHEQEEPHRTKRHNWLHFCLRCGADLSRSPRYTKHCQQCRRNYV